MEQDVNNIASGGDYLELNDVVGYKDYSALVQTMTRHLFEGKGYSNPEHWAHIDVKEIQAKCEIVQLDEQLNAAKRILKREIDNIAIECSGQYVSSALEAFLRHENLRYFRIYLCVAIPLILLALILNAVAISAILRVRQRYLRHFVLTSLSISDVLLSLTLLLKRCGDPDVLASKPTVSTFSNYNTTTPQSIDSFFDQLLIRSDFSAGWQVGYVMSALGLFCLSVDNVLAIATPFFYEKLMVHPNWSKGFIAILWLIVIASVMLLHVFNISNSFSVQIFVCVLMLILLFCIMGSYIFTCSQAHLHQVKLAEQTLAGKLMFQRVEQRDKIAGHRFLARTDSGGFELVPRTRFRGFLTIGLLVLSCLACWSPLVGYLLIDEDTLASAHNFFNQYLCIALIVLHLNSVIDPVIYCLRMPDIRRSLFNIFGYQNPRRSSYIPTDHIPRQTATSRSAFESSLSLPAIDDTDSPMYDVKIGGVESGVTTGFNFDKCLSKVYESYSSEQKGNCKGVNL